MNNIIKILIAIICILIIASLLFASIYKKEVKVGDIITDFTQLNKLEVYKATMSTIIDIKQGNDSVKAEIIGDVIITVDFDKALIKSMDNGRKIFFSLPTPEANKCLIHEELSSPKGYNITITSKIYDFFSENSLGADLYKVALEEAQIEIKNKVMDDNIIIKEAKRITENIISNLCANLGVVPLIHWKADILI